MNTINPFSESLSLHDLFNELIEDLTDRPNYNIYGIGERALTETQVLHEFKSNPVSEIGTDITESYFGIYMTFGPKQGENRENFFSELYEYWPLFINPLKNYLYNLLTENTDNFPMNFIVEFDTGGFDTNEVPEDNYYDISIRVIDNY